jgi:hypothetical protein
MVMHSLPHIDDMRYIGPCNHAKLSQRYRWPMALSPLQVSAKGQPLKQVRFLCHEV